MPTSSRFAVSVHILTAILMKDGDALSSDRIAISVGTNPSLIRKLIAVLTRAGITKTCMGAGGGTLLARPADQITLLQIYRAAEGVDLFAVHASPPNPDCLVGRNILPVLEAATSRAQTALERELEAVSLADFARDVTARAKIYGGTILV
jgi:Rrf2 family protein